MNVLMWIAADCGRYSLDPLRQYSGTRGSKEHFMHSANNPWKPYKRWNRISILCFLVAIPTVLIAPSLHIEFAEPYIAALVGLIFAYGVLRVSLFRCPRCSQKFISGRASLGRECANCGLKLNEDPGTSSCKDPYRSPVNMAVHTDDAR